MILTRLALSAPLDLEGTIERVQIAFEGWLALANH